jgi:hypothetical protein
MYENVEISVSFCDLFLGKIEKESDLSLIIEILELIKEYEVYNCIEKIDEL